MPRKRLNDQNDVSASQSKRRRQTEEPLLSQSSVSMSMSQSSTGFNRSGKIMKVHLTNFMCHENLQIEFNQRVNLLVGRNGSGKSAILTALVVGLGAKASTTSRSANLKSLIKTGENSASIEIEIANLGIDAYDPDRFGDKIIVKRKLAASGASFYEIKDELGHVVSKSRDDLTKILLFHNIQTDNPVFVLNQDAARSFLKDLDPVKNYTLFLKATQMELILEKLDRCVQLYNVHKTKLNVTKKQLQAAEVELKVLQEKYEQLKSVEEIKATVASYKLQKLWLKVTEQENKIAEIEEEISQCETEKQQVQDQINDSGDEAGLQSRLDGLQKKVNETNTLLEDANRTLTNLKAKYNEENLKYQSEQQQRFNLKKRCQNIESQIQSINDDISQRTESSSSRNSRLRLEIEEKKARLDSEHNDVEAMVTTLKQELHLNEHNKEKNSEEYQAAKAEKHQLESRISRNRQELHSIASSSNDRLSVYGSHMKSLLEMIERAYKSRKFKALPIGPVGRYLEVPNKKWRGVIEQLLGGVLTSFIVTCGPDRLVLDKIIKTHFQQARHTIITSTFRDRVYNVENGAVARMENAHLLMDLIKCSEPNVMNCLIDSQRIESILLVEDQSLAEHLTSDECNVPRNLLKVILLDPLIEYCPSPMYRAYSLNPRNPRYLQVNTDDRKKALNEEISRYYEQQQQIDGKMQSIRQQLGDIEEHLKQKRGLLRKHETTLNDIKMKLDELNNFEFPSENEEETLRKEVQKLKENLEEIRTRLKEKETYCMKLKQTVFEMSKDVKKQQEKIQSYEEESSSLMEELNSRKLEATKRGKFLEVLTRKIGRLDVKITGLKTTLDDEGQSLSEYQTAAIASGDRVDTNKSHSELNNAIRSLEVKVKEICSTNENIADVEGLVKDKELKLQSDRQCTNSIQTVLDALKRSRNQRFKTLKCLHEHMAIRVTHTFKQILKIRNFEGELYIDHTNKKLTMNIIPRDNHVENAVSNTKSLSGGERSFVTVALLLSLWSCIDHPFYFLDEYDVFTDELNRKMITQLLLSEADKKAFRQFTFLTPQDLSFVEASDKIKIHRMADPRSTQ